MAMTKRLNKQFSNEFINIEEMILENHFLLVLKSILTGTLYMMK